jgi:hypothetical protein
MIARFFGWECPKCGTVHAPWVPDCDCVKGGNKKQLGLYRLCLKCHQTYGDDVAHTCSSQEME